MRFEPEDRLGGQALLSGRDDEFQATLRAHPFMRPVHWRLTEMRLEDVSDVILLTTEILHGFFFNSFILFFRKHSLLKYGSIWTPC